MAGLLLTTAPAKAGTIQWTFQSESSIYGSTGDLITGWFDYDGTSITNWDITLPATSWATSMPSVEMTAANSVTPTYPIQGQTSFGIEPSNDYWEYTLSLFNSSLNLGSTGTFSNIEWQETYNPSGSESYGQYYVGNMVGTQITPEPGTWALLSGGALLLLGLAWRRRGVAAQPGRL